MATDWAKSMEREHGWQLASTARKKEEAERAKLDREARRIGWERGDAVLVDGGDTLGRTWGTVIERLEGARLRVQFQRGDLIVPVSWCYGARRRPESIEPTRVEAS